MLHAQDKENPNEDDDTTQNIEQSDLEEEQTKDDSDQVIGTNDDQKISNVALFSPSIWCDRFDRDAKEYGRFLQKQSCHYWK
jgi:hypothetical protein